MKKTLIFSLLLLIGGTALQAQKASSKKLVIIRVTQCTKEVNSVTPVIHITEDDGSFREIELEKYKGHLNYMNQNNPNHIKVHAELKKYLLDGYEIQSHTQVLVEIRVWVESFILVKTD